MPEIRHYIVKQTRMVKITANEPGDAADIARAVFANGQNPSDKSAIRGPQDVWGHPTSKVRITRLEVDEEL